MLRIVWLGELELPSPSAHALFTLKMVAALGALGHDIRLVTPGRARVDVAALRRDAGLGGRFELTVLPLVGLPLGRSLYLRAAPLVARAALPDLVWSTDTSLAWRAARLGCRVVVDQHAHLAGSPRLLEAARRLARSPQLAAWAFSSRRLMEIAGGEVELPAGRCLPAHNGIDGLGPPPAPSMRGRPLLVHAGQLYPGRGAEELCAVARALPGVDLQLVGGAAVDQARVRELAAGLANVELVAQQPAARVADYLRGADVLLMPYTSRTTAADRRLQTIDYASPMKMFEYMAAGRPIVATRFPGVMEVLEDGRNAVLCAPDSVEALVAAIRGLLADPERAARLGRQARADVAARTWGARAEAILGYAGRA